MSEARTLASNVAEFLNSASSKMARFHENRWSQDTFCELVDGGCQSPIEDLFYIACKALAESAYTAFDPEPYEHNGTLFHGIGVHLTSQFKVGNYRVDFMITQNGVGPSDVLTPVIVELDGHAFHDKDKKQRAYEKARDRFLVRAGFRVVHYTGSEVVADPFAVAHEVLDMLGVFGGVGSEQYNPNDPLGLDE